MRDRYLQYPATKTTPTNRPRKTAGAMNLMFVK
jgi:hypothetical protein